jgi:tetratricopeptide (TPR) repeat protein
MKSKASSSIAASAAEIDDLGQAATDAADRGELDECERLANQALSLARPLPGGPARDRAIARALRPLGTAFRARGAYADAEEMFMRALECAVDGFGEASIEVAELHNDLGMTFKYAGRFDEAQAAYLRAQPIVEAVGEPEDLASLFHNLGGLAHARRDFVAAEPLARRAIEIRSAAIGPRDPATLLDRSAHAAILDALGRHDEAESAIRGLLPDLEAALGADHPEVAVALNNLAAIVQRRGDLAEAEALYRRVIAIKEGRLGGDSPALAVSLNNLGTVLRGLGRREEAAVQFQRALRLLEGEVAPDHPNLLAIRRNLARLSPAAQS